MSFASLRIGGSSRRRVIPFRSAKARVRAVMNLLALGKNAAAQIVSEHPVQSYGKHYGQQGGAFGRVSAKPHRFYYVRQHPELS